MGRRRSPQRTDGRLQPFQFAGDRRHAGFAGHALEPGIAPAGDDAPGPGPHDVEVVVACHDEQPPGADPLRDAQPDQHSRQSGRKSNPGQVSPLQQNHIAGQYLGSL